MKCDILITVLSWEERYIKGLEMNMSEYNPSKVLVFKYNNPLTADWKMDNYKKTKELLGLVASMVLRCDDCIKYHLGNSHELGVNTEEMYEVFAIANIVGGTIVIPHTRRAAEYWEELNAAQ